MYYPDDTNESPNHGYWYFRRILYDYIHIAGRPDRGPVPSHKKASRVFELIVGRSKTRLLELLTEIAERPAKQHFFDLYHRGIRVDDLAANEFEREVDLIDYKNQKE